MNTDPPYIGATLHALGFAEPETFESITGGYLRLLDETPLNSVEIWMAPEHKGGPATFWPEDYTPERRTKMKAFLDRFPYKGVHLPFMFNNYIAPNPVVAKPAQEQMKLGIRIAGELGCKYAVAHAEWDNRGFIDEDGNFARYREVFRDFATVAEESGLLFCVETCFFIGQRERAYRMVREVDHPNFRITIDSGKCMRNNDYNSDNVLELVDRIGAHVGSTHLYDYPSREDTSRVLPGCKYVDVEAIVAALWKRGFRGAFSLESGGNREQHILAITTLAEYVEKARKA